MLVRYRHEKLRSHLTVTLLGLHPVSDYVVNLNVSNPDWQFVWEADARRDFAGGCRAPDNVKIAEEWGCWGDVWWRDEGGT